MPQLKVHLLLARTFLIPLLLVFLAYPGNACADGFSFAGLNRKTTLRELKTRYPNSPMVGNYVYVSRADSHDHIYGIEIPGSNPQGRLRLTFERPRDLSRDGRPQYPSCQQIFSILEASYGPPAKVEKFTEERSLNRRISWTKGDEVLWLLCFRMESGKFFAEALTVTAHR